MERESEQLRIRDIPSIAKTLDGIESFSAFRRAFPFLEPVLRVLGVDVAKADEVLSQVDDLKVKARDMAMVPDRFNEIFSPLGWIIHADMNLEVAREAISAAETTSTAKAEKILTAYYSPDQIHWMLKRMHAVEAFRPRVRLARIALDDYRAERYHASIPVVLSLLDGIVSELHEKRKGFFAEEHDMTAWASGSNGRSTPSSDTAVTVFDMILLVYRDPRFALPPLRQVRGSLGDPVSRRLGSHKCVARRPPSEPIE